MKFDIDTANNIFGMLVMLCILLFFVILFGLIVFDLVGRATEPQCETQQTIKE